MKYAMPTWVIPLSVLTTVLTAPQSFPPAKTTWFMRSSFPATSSRCSVGPAPVFRRDGRSADELEPQGTGRGAGLVDHIDLRAVENDGRAGEEGEVELVRRYDKRVRVRPDERLVPEARAAWV